MIKRLVIAAGFVLAAAALAMAQIPGGSGALTGGAASVLTGCPTNGDVLYSSGSPGVVMCATGTTVGVVGQLNYRTATSRLTSNDPTTANASIVITNPGSTGNITIENSGDTSQPGNAGLHIFGGSNQSQQMWTNASRVFSAPYVATTTYAQGQVVACLNPGCPAADGKIYTSQSNGNLGNGPVGDGGVHWVTVGTCGGPPCGIAETVLVWDNKAFQASGLELGEAGFFLYNVGPSTVGGEIPLWASAASSGPNLEWPIYFHWNSSVGALSNGSSLEFRNFRGFLGGVQFTCPVTSCYTWTAQASGGALLITASDSFAAWFGTYNNFPLCLVANNSNCIEAIYANGSANFSAVNALTVTPTAGRVRADLGFEAGANAILNWTGTTFELDVGAANILDYKVTRADGWLVGGGNLAVSGQLITATGMPTIASGACGTTTNGAVVAGSTNQAGQITIGGAGAPTTCTISWSATLGSAPKSCVFYPMNAAAATAATNTRTGAPSTAAVVLTATNLASTNWAYMCL